MRVFRLRITEFPINVNAVHQPDTARNPHFIESSQRITEMFVCSWKTNPFVVIRMHKPRNERIEESDEGWHADVGKFTQLRKGEAWQKRRGIQGHAGV